MRQRDRTCRVPTAPASHGASKGKVQTLTWLRGWTQPSSWAWFCLTFMFVRVSLCLCIVGCSVWIVFTKLRKRLVRWIFIWSSSVQYTLQYYNNVERQGRKTPRQQNFRSIDGSKFSSSFAQTVLLLLHHKSDTPP
jgi:hypothetical protein